MTMNSHTGADIVSTRKSEVRKHANIARASAGIGVVSLLVGLTLVKTSLFSVVIPLLALVVFVYSGVKIKKLIDHKDQW